MTTPDLSPKGFSLQTRFILSIAVCMLLVLAISEIIRQNHQRRALHDLSVSNFQVLETATRHQVENLEVSVNASLRDAMEQGEMDRVVKVLNRQAKVEGLLECSLIGPSGKVSYSSVPAALKRPLDPALKGQLFGEGKRLEQESAEAVEMYQPLVAEKSCVKCHNELKEGQVAGVEYLRVSNSEVRKAQSDWDASAARMRSDNLIGGLGMCVGMVIALIVLVTVLVRWLLSKPLFRIVRVLDQISQGDLSNEVDPDLISRPDEIGHLARAMQTMTQNLRQVLQNVSEGVHTLVTSAAGLSSVSSQTTANVKGVSEKASLVATSAEASSTHTISVAAAIEEASSNLASVASATEQMSSTVGEIASNSEKARAIGNEAMQQAQSISTLMGQLGHAAREIGKVTETITDISSQTNLLALNATIEAARAGAAGKSFAVVANEIKELARQTAAATDDIKSKIAGVQNSAGSAISDIEKITTVIKDVGQLVASIAAAIEEQAVVTKDVASNIAQASAGVHDANQRLGQTATASKSIAEDVAGINADVSELRQGGELVQANAVELSHLAEQLKALLAQFRIGDSDNPSQDEAGTWNSPRSFNGGRRTSLAPIPANDRVDTEDYEHAEMG
jgi:methyl-accepting chemotaxis protein